MTQLTPIRGFTSTLVTRSIIIISTIIPILLSIVNVKYWVILSVVPYLTQYHQFWRIVTFQLSAINESDYLFIVIIFWYFKPLERFYGSHKYFLIISLLFVYNAITTIIVMGFGQLSSAFVASLIKHLLFGNTSEDFNITIFNEIISGPLPLLSSLYICYTKFIPVSYEFVIELTNPLIKLDEQETVTPTSKRIILTNHFPVQIIYTLMFINNGFKSFIPCIIGLIVGKLYIYELLPKSRSWNVPKLVYELFINPVNVITKMNWPFTTSQYQPVPQSENPIVIDQEETDDQDDFAVNERNQIRAETPVRPLTGQFLDTFRN